MSFIRSVLTVLYRIIEKLSPSAIVTRFYPHLTPECRRKRVVIVESSGGGINGLADEAESPKIQSNSTGYKQRDNLN